MEGYCDSLLGQGKGEIVCPTPRCTSKVSEDQLSSILTEVDIEKLEKFQLWADARTNPNTRWCPIVDCEGVRKKLCAVHTPVKSRAAAPAQTFPV